MGDDDNPYDPKKQWQDEQLARDAAFEKQKLKDEKARIRRARSAQRQLKKVRDQLRDMGEITDWEDEFIASVDERLDQFDAAFRDRTKGGAADALSMRQKQVLAQMRRKVKDKGKQSPGKKKTGFKPRSSFKSKSNFKPRVRHIEDDMVEEEPKPEPAPVKRKPSLTVIKGGKK